MARLVILNNKSEKLLSKNEPFAYRLVQIRKGYDPVDNIIKNNICPQCKNKLTYSDCLNYNNGKSTFFRFCHKCKKIYFLNEKIEKINKNNQNNKYIPRVLKCSFPKIIPNSATSNEE